ncbi:Kunitz/Bovine pancreatic trypsin inhibitor domain protein [Ancylostoma ceylanicum]|uniref:Kunitz/Bovine pancreatic trypsin inhibitor domain protein n=1 Tax=Ancylostoma ceylanicum TaxID=53326 RepID=A0A0D6LB50_9BILA|nr:Kunitz/Bovine pancreatic trypsin inhibitor domain protein [Ancylostoma ceylanicum]
MRLYARVTCALILLGQVAAYSECIDQPCDECRFFFKAGDVCQARGTHPVLFCDPSSNLIRRAASSFLECDGSVMLLRECTLGSLYEDGSGCVDPTAEPLMQGLSVSGSGRVGDVCQYNTDCLGGMYCSGGVCTCLSTYIMREYYCYENFWRPLKPGKHVQSKQSNPYLEVNPNQPGCTYDVQCEAVWPGAKCRMDSSIGTCRCPALNDPNPAAGSLPVGCTVGSSATVEPVVGLHGGAACIWPSEGEFIGDIYDCIHTSPHVNLATKFPLSSYAPSADGVCCPSRALACIQPQATGPNPTEPRWWYNSVTGTCQQFMWDPTASDAKYHSANNFRTIQHCESYCRDTCQRGSPQYSGEPSANVERPVTSCSSSASCGSDFQCSSIGSQHLCCLTPSSITTLQQDGVRTLYTEEQAAITTISCPGTNANCTALDCNASEEYRCGWARRRSDAKPTDSVPRPTSAGSTKAFAVRENPSLSETICAQPLRVGDCTESVKRYWYNAKARQCQMFEYTGCQGNDNNFETVLDCQSFCKNAIPEPKCVQGQAFRNQFGDFITCTSGIGCPSNYECYYDGEQWGCCPTKAFTCSLNADSGVQCGSGSTFRFHYNAHTQNCESFQYNGCDGNSNNFANRDQCEQYCSVGGCPHGGTALRDHAGMTATCSTQENCPSSHECVPVVVGTSSITRCCPTRACPAGNVAYVDPNSQMPIQCNDALSNSCPNGYTCTFNALINGHVCCGASDYGVCPENEKAFISTSDMSPRECVVNIDASCPPNYLCRFNMQRNKYFCCASVSGKTCPVGKFLHRDSHTSLPTRCTMGRAEQCPDGYTCQSYLANAAQGFCCTSSAVCPDEAEFVIDEHSQLPRACTMGSFVGCPNGFSCRSLTSNVEGFCCRTGSSAPPAITDGCPPGNYVFTKEGEVAPCDPFNPPNAPCPDGFTCQWSLSNQKYQCCGSNPAPPPVRVRCPADSVAFVGLSGEPEKCVVGQSKCPFGFACRRSVAGHHICCTARQVSCSDEEVNVDGMCFSRAPPGAACQKSEQCTGGSMCHLGVCECPALTTPIGGFCQGEIKCGPEQVKHGGACHNKVELGKACVVTQQCPDREFSYATVDSHSELYGTPLREREFAERWICRLGNVEYQSLPPDSIPLDFSLNVEPTSKLRTIDVMNKAIAKRAHYRLFLCAWAVPMRGIALHPEREVRIGKCTIQNRANKRWLFEMPEPEIEASSVRGHGKSGVLQSQHEAVSFWLQLPSEQQKNAVHVLHGCSAAKSTGIFRELYSNFTTRISPIYDDITIDVRRGVRQGDTVSPKLFTATLEDVMRRLEWDNMGVRVDGRLLHHLRFADDIVLITPNNSQAERMLADACGKIGLQLNLTKTMFMRNGWVPDSPFSLNGTTISECSSYVYLGREVNMMNDLAPELGRRKRAAWGACKSIEDVVKKTKNTRLRIAVCPSGRVPYLLNGLPQRCTTQRCPRGYECTYKDHDYVCCSSAGKAGKRLPTAAGKEQCSRGSALIYPTTRMPVICTPGKKGCPPGTNLSLPASVDWRDMLRRDGRLRGDLPVWRQAVSGCRPALFVLHQEVSSVTVP